MEHATHVPRETRDPAGRQRAESADIRIGRDPAITPTAPQAPTHTADPRRDHDAQIVDQPSRRTSSETVSASSALTRGLEDAAGFTWNGLTPHGASTETRGSAVRSRASTTRQGSTGRTIPTAVDASETPVREPGRPRPELRRPRRSRLCPPTHLPGARPRAAQPRPRPLRTGSPRPPRPRRLCSAAVPSPSPRGHDSTPGGSRAPRSLHAARPSDRRAGDRSLQEPLWRTEPHLRVRCLGWTTIASIPGTRRQPPGRAISRVLRAVAKSPWADVRGRGCGGGHGRRRVVAPRGHAHRLTLV